MCYAALVHEYFVILLWWSVCYAALVHEYFVILLWWRVCVMLVWCMSTLLSYYGGECVLCCSGA